MVTARLMDALVEAIPSIPTEIYVTLDTSASTMKLNTGQYGPESQVLSRFFRKSASEAGESDNLRSTNASVVHKFLGGPTDVLYELPGENRVFNN